MRIKYLIPDEAMSGIYKITTSDGHYYIGSTNNFRERYTRHARLLQRGIHSNIRMQRVYDKGADWTFERLEECLREDLTLIEQQYLDRCADDSLCMNLILAVGYYPGNSGFKHTEAFRRAKSQTQKGTKRGPYRKRTAQHSLAISLAKKGKPGRLMSESTRTKLSMALTGRKLTPEHRAKLSRARLGKTPWNKGKQLTPEHIHKRQMSRALNR